MYRLIIYTPIFELVFIGPRQRCTGLLDLLAAAYPEAEYELLPVKASLKVQLTQSIINSYVGGQQDEIRAM